MMIDNGLQPLTPTMAAANLEPLEPYRSAQAPWRCRCLTCDAGLLPLVDYPGSHKPWPCRCRNCGSVVNPHYHSVKQGQGGCLWCAPSGFDIAAPAFVYLIEHRILGAVKVGIGNVAANRLGQHANHGWLTLLIVPVTGQQAIRIERAILSWWRKDLGLPPYLSKIEMPQAGWTETVDADAIDIPTTIERIQRLADEA